jgi:DNA repair photolyase
MPTGYTAGIIHGEITTFEQFATQCTRAFGATIHMRDNPMDSPYEPRTPSEYYVNSIQSEREELEKMESLADEDIVREFETSMRDSFEYHEKGLEKDKANLEKLNSILSSAKGWVPPTEEHEGLRTFMIEQIESTIKMDGDPSYHVNKIVQIKQKMEEGIDPKVYREERMKEIKERILYFEDEHQKELVRCKQSNDWMEKFFESIQTK